MKENTINANKAYTYNGNGGNGAQATALDNQLHQLLGLIGSPSVGSGIACADNTCGTSSVMGSDSSNVVMAIGKSNSNNYLTGPVAEVGLWLSSTYPTTLQQTSICHNQFSYWATSVSC